MWTKNFQMYKLDFEKAEKPDIKLPTPVGSWKKQENFRKKNIYCYFIDYAKAFECVDHNKLKILKEIRTPDHLISGFLRNLYTCQEATVRTRHGTMDWFKIGKGVCQSCLLSPCLFKLYAEHIRWNERLDESLPGIKTVSRNNNNLRYTDDTTLMAESEEELKSLLMRLREESEKAGLKLNIHKTVIMTLGPITSWQMKKKRKQLQILFFRAKTSLQTVNTVMKLKDVCFLEGKLWQI